MLDFTNPLLVCSLLASLVSLVTGRQGSVLVRWGDHPLPLGDDFTVIKESARETISSLMHKWAAGGSPLSLANLKGGAANYVAMGCNLHRL